MLLRDRNKKWKNNFERLNGTIEVLVIERVFIVPHSSIWSCHLVTHDPENAVISWIRFALVYNCASPSHDGRLLSHGGANGLKLKFVGPPLTLCCW